MQRPILEELNFRSLVEEHMPYVWRQLRLLGVAERDLEDSCQEVFVVVHRRLPEFEGRASVRTWIHRIAYWVASDYRRNARRRPESPHSQLPEQVFRLSPQVELETQQAWRKLLALLDLLPDGQRQVFVLFEVEGRPMREIVELLGCPSSTAYTWLEAAREKLRAAMTEGEP